MTKTIDSTEAPSSKPRTKTPAPREHSIIREWSDELILVFMVVLFIKMFLVELYKIPSGSMTPTLLGGQVAHVDLNGDKNKDIVFWTDNRQTLSFLREGERYVHSPDVRITSDQNRIWEASGQKKTQFDRILVNKLAYNFSKPERGDVVVFKVPKRIFREEAPIYIKRLAGVPGETLSFAQNGALQVNDKLVETPDFYRTQRYVPEVSPQVPGFNERSEIDYVRGAGGWYEKAIHVPDNEFYVFGDNAHGSLDSRYWGGVPFDNFKGRAFMRVFPLLQMKFIE